MKPPKANDDGSCSDSDISIDGDVAFAFVDFSGVDFGDDDDDDDGDDGCAERPPSSTPEKTPHHVAVDDPSVSLRDVDREKRNEKSSKGPDDNDDEDDAAIRRSTVDDDLPDGQTAPREERPHDPILFEAQSRRVDNLCRWYELGIRPSVRPTSSSSSSRPMIDLLAAHRGKDDDLLASKVDDLSELRRRSILAQDDLNSNLPPFPLSGYEDRLEVATSTIEGAGNGLFATAPIPRGAVACHYSGYRHHYQSQKRLRDRAYVLKLQNGWPKHDRRNDGFVDALPTEGVLARFINDPREEERCNVKFEHVQRPGIWHCPVVAQRDIEAGEELFVSYGPRYWSESRMVGG